MRRILVVRYKTDAGWRSQQLFPPGSPIRPGVIRIANIMPTRGGTKITVRYSWRGKWYERTVVSRAREISHVHIAEEWR